MEITIGEEAEKKQIENILNFSDIILSKPVIFSGLNIKEQYAGSHNIKDLNENQRTYLRNEIISYMDKILNLN